MSDIDIHFGRRLRFRRLNLGLTQTQLGQSVGVRFQQIQKYECAATRMSAAMLVKLAHALDVPVGYFCDGLPLIHPTNDAQGARPARQTG